MIIQTILLTLGVFSLVLAFALSMAKAAAKPEPKKEDIKC